MSVNKAFIFVFIVIGLLFDNKVNAQTVTKQLTFDEVMQLAREQSPDAIMAKHRFRANYWQYRTFKADYLPNVSLGTTFPE